MAIPPPKKFSATHFYFSCREKNYPLYKMNETSLLCCRLQKETYANG
ncbi:hypothetical protein B4096_2658 [Heyndrickxia coagulans]|nr:hypothetical protein B4100_3271 [Heyndrickxia coagulans]KYC91703.1 hypothetical protein B4096_2658 [Heyndrickxia coagulans]